MPLHDHECTVCGYEHEEVIEWDNHSCLCPMCQGLSVRIYKGFKGIAHDAPPWMKDVVEVVDKDGGAHCQDFIKHQTRGTYNNWMKGEGLRPLEPGEPMKRKPRDTSGLRKKVKESFKARNTITVRG